MCSGLQIGLRTLSSEVATSSRKLHLVRIRSHCAGLCLSTMKDALLIENKFFQMYITDTHYDMIIQKQ